MEKGRFNSLHSLVYEVVSQDSFSGLSAKKIQSRKNPTDSFTVEYHSDFDNYEGENIKIYQKHEIPLLSKKQIIDFMLSIKKANGDEIFAIKIPINISEGIDKFSPFIPIQEKIIEFGGYNQYDEKTFEISFFDEIITSIIIGVIHGEYELDNFYPNNYFLEFSVSNYDFIIDLKRVSNCFELLKIIYSRKEINRLNSVQTI